MIYRSLLLPLLILATTLSAFSQKIGLVLSGGGARGYAHIGVIKALEENGIPIDYVTGTSAGALVGSMYVTGVSPQQMENIVLSDDFKDWSTGNLNEDLDYYFKKKEWDASWVTFKVSYDSTFHMSFLNTLVNSAQVDFTLMENTSAAIAQADYDFNNLFVPFRCVASDIKNKREQIFNCGDLGRAVRASIAYPLYLTPMTADNELMYDGGIYNNFPSDVMLNEFNPDIMIGVNVSGGPDILNEGNFFSQLKNMIIQSQHTTLPGNTDILITPNVSDMGVFDFSNFKAVVDSGYAAAMLQMPYIKSVIAKRVYAEELTNRRNEYVKNFPPLVVDSIIITGVTASKAAYITRVLNPEHRPLKLKQLKQRFFKLIADENIRYGFPRLVYKPEKKMYDLELFVKPETDLRIDVGGDFSSRPISEGFIGVRYNILSRQSLGLDANTYFGKLYNSGQLKLRVDFPGKPDFFAEPFYTINRLDYYKSSNAFTEDERPSYLIKSDQSFGINIGIPARNKGQVIGSGAFFNCKDQYYQTKDFLKSDTADVTRFDGYTLGLNFERNTLNRKMYASKGTFLTIRLRYINGTERTKPGSKSQDQTSFSAAREWWQVKLIYDNYFTSLGPIKLGFYSETNFSGQPFFSNYTASVLQAPGFYPTQESKTLFLENFHSFNYLGTGLKSVFQIRSNIDFRLEGYILQPFQEITKSVSNRATYGDALSVRYYIASAAAIYHSPIGPVALTLNYYDRKEKSFSLMFHLGYILFNRSALD